MLNKREYFNLINAANIASGLLEENFIKSCLQLGNFLENKSGIPILIEADENIFKFTDKNVFNLDPIKLCRIIYGHEDLSYVGFKHAFQSMRFLNKIEVNSNYKKYYLKIIKQNQNCFRFIRNLKKNHKKLGAFQTRNIPHGGHEKIIQSMLEKCDHVVINPVIGPKKSGDIKLEVLETVYNYLSKNKLKRKITFIPIYANMYYAGPREAVHHTKIRQKLGFDLFSVGRDHAGAGGIYDPNAAHKEIENIKKHLNIEVFSHNGAGYCQGCSEITIIGQCGCSEGFIQDIAGSDLRKSIRSGDIFPMADINMQYFLKSINLELFEK